MLTHQVSVEGRLHNAIFTHVIFCLYEVLSQSEEVQDVVMKFQKWLYCTT